MAAQDGNHTATAAAASGFAGSNGEDAILHKEGDPVENNRLGLASIFFNDMAWTRKALQFWLITRSRGAFIQNSKASTCCKPTRNKCIENCNKKPFTLLRSATPAVLVSSAKRAGKLLAVQVCLGPVMTKLPKNSISEMHIVVKFICSINSVEYI